MKGTAESGGRTEIALDAPKRIVRMIQPPSTLPTSSSSVGLAENGKIMRFAALFSEVFRCTPRRFV